MPSAQSNPQHDSPSSGRSKLHIYSAEATGLIVIALLILVIVLARYWHHIPWNVR